MPTKETTSGGVTSDGHRPTLQEEVRAAIGTERLVLLDQQPLAIAAGGIDAILQAACEDAAGHAKPILGACVRTLQLCGSQASLADINTWSEL